MATTQTETPKGNGGVTPTPAPAADKPQKTVGERIDDGKVAGMVSAAREHGRNLFLRDNPEALTLAGEIGMQRELSGIEARLGSKRYLDAKRALRNAIKG